MAKIYLTIICAILTLTTNAQITLNSNDNAPSVGDSFTYMVDQQTTVLVGPGGANQTWDLSGASTDTSLGLKYVNVSNGSASGDYPDANILEIGIGSENYMSVSDTAMKFEGNYITGYGQVIYTDKREFLKFPMTYNDVFNEPFAATVESFQTGQTLNRSGSTEIRADGYGDLILPYDTLHNVLRIMHVAVYADTFGGFPIANYRDTIYTWYNALTHVNVASYSVNYTNGTKTVAQLNILMQPDVATGIEKTTAGRDELLIYPNPVNQTLNVKNRGTATIARIYDLGGKGLHTVKLVHGKNTIDVSSLDAGIYFIRYRVKAGGKTRKFVVQ